MKPTAHYNPGGETARQISDHAPERDRSRGAERAIVFALCAAAPTYLALDGGGYDLVVRQGTGLAVWVAIALGLAFGVLPRARPPRMALWTFGAFAALVALSTLALTTTLSDQRTAAEIARLVSYAGFAAAAWLGLRASTWPAAVGGLSVSLATVTALALISRLAPAAFPPNPLLEVLGSERLFYPFGYWNAVAAWSALATASMLAWSTASRRAAIAGVALAAVPAGLLTIYLTYSRGGALAAVAGAAAVIWLARNRRRAAANAAVAGAAGFVVILVARGQPEIVDGSGAGGAALVVLALLAAGGACGAFAVRRKLARRRPAGGLSPGMLAGVAAAAIAIAIAIGAAAGAWDEFTGGEPAAATAGADPADRLTTFSGDRWAYWSAALDAAATRPLVGVGPGAFEYWWEATGDPEDSVRDAHSLVLEPLAELGLPGLLAVAALVGGLLVAAIRPHPRPRRTAAATAAIAIVLTFVIAAAADWLWEFPGLVAVALIAAGAAGAAGSRPRRARRSGAWPGPRLRLLLVVVAIACAASQVPGLVSEQLRRASQSAAVAGDLDEAESLADDAIQAAGWSADAYAQRALVRARRGDLVGAIADAAKAISLEPMEARYSLLAGEIQREIATSVRR